MVNALKVMNSVERVKAALHFSGPDKVPLFTPGLGSDVLGFFMIHPNSWQPGHTAEETNLFPHPINNLLFSSRLYRWSKPIWAKNTKYRGLKWMKYHPRSEIDEWGCIWNRIEGSLSMGHPGRPSLPDWKNFNNYLEKYNPDPTDKTRYLFFTKLEKLSRIVLPKRYRIAALWNMGPVHIAGNMRGFSHFLIDHRKYPNELKRLLNHLTEFFVQCMKSWIKFGTNLHGFTIADDLGASFGTMGLISTITFLTYGTGALIGGPLSDRLGSLSVARISIGLGGLMSIIFLFAQNVFLFGLGMFLMALCASFYHPTANGLIAKAFPENTGASMGIHNAAGNFGQVFTPTVAFFIGVRISWRLSFVFFGAMSLIIAVLLERIEVNEGTMDRSMTGYIEFIKTLH